MNHRLLRGSIRPARRIISGRSLRPRFGRRLLRAESLERREVLAAAPLVNGPVINELMAINATTIQDEDGDYSNWVELRNIGDAPIDLGGHYLTRDAGDLDHWQFPAGTVLAADEHLLVFASGKDRRAAGNPLHTNFTLDEGGASSFVALVAADGATIVDSLAAYPPQTADHSYGRLRRSQTKSFVERGDIATYLVPDDSDDALIDGFWQGVGFVPGAAGETGWTNGSVAIGYETLPTSMGFVVTSHKTNIQLSSLDGPNGAEALIFNGTNRVGSPVSRTDPTINIFNSWGGGFGHFGDSTDPNVPGFVTAIDDYAIHAIGTIFVAPEKAGLWTFGVFADDGTRVRVDGAVVLNDNVLAAPHDAFGQRFISSGTHTIELTFFDRGGDSLLELFAARGGFDTFQADAFRLIGDVAAGGLPTGNLDQVINTDIQSAMHNVNGSVYVRVPFAVAAPADVASLSAQFEYDDGYVAYLNGVEVSRTNAPVQSSYNSSALTNSGLTAGSLDLASQRALLVSGQNVLAIHALNSSPADGDFYVSANLTGRVLLPEALEEFAQPTPGAANGVLPPVISEFMAINGTTIEDEDGDPSDWLEIHNPGEFDVNLGGYYLTDDAANLMKWTLPAVTLAPADQLLVFASGKDRTSAGGRLHTNFELEASGGYLALVQPDGVTTVSEFADYPAQAEDVSYGFEGSTFTTTLLDAGAAAVAYVPTAANPAVDLNWRNLDYDTTGWNVGTTAVGFETATGYQALLGIDLRSQMRVTVGTGRTTAYIRVPFTIDDPAAVGTLTLRMKYDDGFAAYINGTQVAAANAPVPLAFDSAATITHDDQLAVVFQDFDITAFADALVAGQNVLAIHGLDNATTSSDFLIIPSLVAKGSASLSNDLRFFATPTPGLPNETGVLGFIGETRILKKHGIYDGPMTVHIGTDDETPADIQIRYTTNGEPPTETTGTLYTGPITIGSTTVLRAAAFRPGYLPSKIATATYIFLNDVLMQTAGAVPPGWPTSWTPNVTDYGMDPAVLNNPVWGSQLIDSFKSLPVWSIAMDFDDLFGPTGIYSNANGEGIEWQRPGSIEVLPFGGSSYEPRTEAGFQAGAGIRMEGGFSRSSSYAKHNFSFFMRRQYGDVPLNYPLFGEEGADTFEQIDLKTSEFYSWSLQNDSRDTFARDPWSRFLQRDLGQPHTRSKFYHLFVNGHYWGLYYAVEVPQATYGPIYFGGDTESYDAIAHDEGPYASVAWDGTMDEWRRFFCAAQDLSYPAQVATRDIANCGPAPVPMTQSERFAAYMTLQGLNPDGTRNPDYQVDLDADNLIAYMLTIIYSGNADGPISNFIGNNRVNHFYALRRCSVPPATNPERDCDGQEGWRFFTTDSENTLGTHGLTFDRTGPWTAGDLDTLRYSNPQTIFEYLWSVPEFRTRLADTLQRAFFNNGPLTPQKNIDRWQEIAGDIGSYTTSATGGVTSASGPIVAEQARWGNNSNLTAIAWGTELESVIRTFFPARGDIVLNQLRADGLWTAVVAPALSQFGGEVTPGFQFTMSAPQGVVYYTTDGSDPRAVDSQGNVSISPAAIPYNSVQNYVTAGSPLKWRVPTGDPSENGWQTAGYGDAAWNNGALAIGYDNGGVETGPGFTLRVVDTSSGPSIPNIATGTDLLDDGQAAGYIIASDTTHFVPYVDLGDTGNLNSPATLSVPGTSDLEQYAIRATTTVTIPAGTWSVAVGSDDGFKLTIPGITFTARGNADSGTAANVLQFSAPRGHGQTNGQFTTASQITANLVLDFYEAGGGDSVELSILDSGTTTFNASTFKTLQDGQFGWTVRTIGSPVNYDPFIATDVESAMNNVNSSLYTRIPFTVADPSAVETLLLKVRRDDGFVAYINGTEVARRNASGAPGAPLAFNASATTVGTDSNALLVETIDISPFGSAVLQGNNVLAVQVLNFTSDNPDLFFDAQLDAVYAGTPISLSQSTRILARTLQDGQWSPVTDATFLIGAPLLRVTELNYSPAPPTAAEAAAGYTTSDFEFIEVTNVGPQPSDLTGIQFTAGVPFTFTSGPGAPGLAAGARTLVVRNEAAFQARYGGSFDIAGQYAPGNLADEGERLTLHGALGEIIQDFAFDGGWYSLADGAGFSLSIINSTSDPATWNDRAAWRPSDHLHGSPGSGDSGIAPPPDSIVINEILAYPSPADPGAGARIEFRDTSAAPIDLSGFYLSNDPNELMKYRLPTLPVLPGGDHLVVNESSTFGSTFSLSPLGGTLILQAADAAGALTGFRTSFEYGGSEAGVTQGPFVNSAGQVDAVHFAAPTFGAANSEPRVGPIVIGEIMYNPAFGGDEFIELANISAAPVSLDNWRFEQGVTYTFGALALAAGQRLLVTSIDPAAFRTKYAIPAEIRIVGPYTGVLNNGGETVTLVKPGDVGQSIVMDRVRYDDQAPWPVSPDGTGPSLARIDLATYGQEPVNWLPGNSGGTPGAGNQFFDETPPTIPAITSITVQSGPAITLVWSASSDPHSAVSHYTVFRNSIQLSGPILGTMFTDTTATFDQSYRYTVASVNTSGVASPLSTPQPARIMNLASDSRIFPTQVRLSFTQSLDVATAQNVANYFISNGVTVVLATVEASGTSVLLTVAAPLVDGQPHRVVVNNIVGAAPGTVMVPDTAVVFTPGVSNGLLGEYYDSTATSFDDTGTPGVVEPAPDMPFGAKIGERVDTSINFTWLAAPAPAFTPPLPATANNTFGVRWTGRVLAPVSGVYTFSFVTSTSDGVRFWLDADADGLFEDIASERLVNAWPTASTAPAGTTQTASPITLVAGRFYNIRIDAYDDLRDSAQIS